MVSLGDRVRELRTEKGLSQDDLAKLVDVSQQAIDQLESGTTKRPRYLLGLARVFGVRPEWLQSGQGRKVGGQMVPVVGYVGAGAEVIGIDDYEQGGGLDEIELPMSTSDDAVAVIVRGASMYPAYNDGDMIFYDRIQEDPTACLGREAVVRLEDGRTFIKYLTQGSAPGFFTLLSYNAPPMTDIPVQWAARVHWVRRR